MLVSKLALGAAAVPLALGGISSTATQADAHERGHRMPVEIREAIENNDYDAWYDAVTTAEKSPFADHATEEVFTALQDIHELREEGDKEAARAAKQTLAEELGIELRQKGKRYGKRAHFKADLSEEAREELKSAVESGDYNVWLEVAGEYLPEERIEKMTEERFLEMVERKAQFNR